jgi:DNA-binding transcriptional ArsR family regulator
MTAPFRIARLKTVEVSTAAEPVRNALVSLSMLHSVSRDDRPAQSGFHADQPDQVDAWVVTAARSLSAEELERNRLIFEALGSILLPDRESDFPSYLQTLAEQRPEELRDRVLRPLLREGTTTELLLTSLDAYLARIAEVYHNDYNDAPDAELHSSAHRLLRNPQALQALVVGHLQGLWDGSLAADWRKREKLVKALVGALQQRSIPAASAPATIRAFIGRDLPVELGAQLSDVRKLVFVPSPHVSLYASRFNSSDTLWVFVAVSIITGWALRQAPIKSSEVHARIEPLADTTNLRILDLLAQHGELSSQEMISMLGVSQSGLSRHLKSLGAYVIERRDQGATKRFRLSMSHLDWTLVTLRRFMEGDAERAIETANLSDHGRGFAPAAGQPIGPHRTNSVPVDAPADLRRFMDHENLLTAFPTRRRDQLAVLQYLADLFDDDRSYTEKEVNEIIRSRLNPRYDDFATLRRELYNVQFLGREKDGSRYWRIRRPDETVPG